MNRINIQITCYVSCSNHYRKIFPDLEFFALNATCIHCLQLTNTFIQAWTYGGKALGYDDSYQNEVESVLFERDMNDVKCRQTLEQKQSGADTI